MSFVIGAIVVGLIVGYYVHHGLTAGGKMERYYGLSEGESLAGMWVGTFDTEITTLERAGAAALGLALGGIGTMRRPTLNVGLGTLGTLAFVIETDDGPRNLTFPREEVRVVKTGSGPRVHGQASSRVVFDLPDGSRLGALMPGDISMLGISE